MLITDIWLHLRSSGLQLLAAAVATVDYSFLSERIYVQWNTRSGRDPTGCMHIPEWLCYESALCPPVCHPPAAFFGAEDSAALQDSQSHKDQQGPTVIKEFIPFDLCLPCANFDKLTIILATACLGRMEWCIVNNYLYVDHTKYRAIK